jgi:hypothetical protein
MWIDNGFRQLWSIVAGSYLSLTAYTQRITISGFDATGRLCNNESGSVIFQATFGIVCRHLIRGGNMIYWIVFRLGTIVHMNIETLPAYKW